MLEEPCNGSNIVALRFGDHGTKQMLGVAGWKVWPVSNFAQQHATTSNNMQQVVQTDATCNIQQCWELLANNVASVCTPCCMLDVVACCCAKFETGQTFQPTTPNISFVPWSPKPSATMLDPFAQLFQHCWGHAHYAWFTKTYGLYPSHDVLQIPTLLGVVASVCT